MRRHITAALAAATLLTLPLLGACGTDEEPASPGGSGSSSPAGDTGDTGGEAVAIAFFGFAKANSFANATFSGIEEYAAENNATVEFFDGAFDSAAQVQQIQDATTSGRFQVYIIQANDGAAVIPAVEAAIAAGITVVAEFTPIGTAYDTAEPQVEGVYSIVDVPADNGRILADMGLGACEELGADPCKVAYLQGNASLPLDNTRTEAAVAALEAGGVTVVDNFQGGYTQDEGRAAVQDLLQAHPDVNVIIGSSQAIAGAESLVDTSKVKLIGNGGSRPAVEAVQSGRWYGTYYADEVRDGYEAAKIGVEAARGGSPANATNIIDLDFNLGGGGTKDTLEGVTGSYDE
ncbi:MAG: sugar ABC transporter substrate-binding protein [Bifidobacteriaceae bacterium]|jgi:ribose transport system substrate-binding protein|nr:sugar ABC transporter substrate-binding protein [Bifidobacteriaceae bacterium]